MAIIIGQKEQHAALKEIKTACKEMGNTNKFLDCQNTKGKYTISFISEDGARCSAVAHAEGKDVIDRLVLHHKHLVSDRVVKLAETHRILLDLDEKLTFGLDLTPEEQDELDARMLAELEAAEQSAKQNSDSSSSSEEDNKPFYDPEGLSDDLA